MKRNNPDEELIERVGECVRRALPKRWTLDAGLPSERPWKILDGWLEITNGDDERQEFLIATKSGSFAASPNLVDWLRATRRLSPLPLIFASDYIGPSTRERLEAAGINYADATGWFRISNDIPMLLLQGIGTERAPRSRAAERISFLGGPSASRIVRTILDSEAPIGVRELATATSTSPGTVSKVLATLQDEGTIDRLKGTITVIRRRSLLDRWIQDYGFLTSNKTRTFLAPRGVEVALERLLELDGVCVTGPAALRERLPKGVVPIVPTTQITAYAADPMRVASALRAVAAGRDSANVTLAVPADPTLLTKKQRQGKATIAPLGLALADTKTMPGRLSAMADQLIGYLAESNPSWGE